MESRHIALDIGLISAQVVYHQIEDQWVKTLLVDFAESCRMLSTSCGYKKLRYAANHYTSPASWDTILDFETYMAKVHLSLGMDRRHAAMLVTAADVDEFAYERLGHGHIMVGCLVTAGVKANAMRMGVDEAQVDGPGISLSAPGTINVILFTNASLTDGAMANAFINITEAKTGALHDLNVRSVYSPQSIATGTGTDGITVVSGNGPGFASTSGHLKIGELIGKGVRQAVIRAVKKQSGHSHP